MFSAAFPSVCQHCGTRIPGAAAGRCPSCRAPFFAQVAVGRLIDQNHPNSGDKARFLAEWEDLQDALEKSET